MPFFSFILNKNYLPSELGILDSNIEILFRKKKNIIVRILRFGIFFLKKITNLN